MAGSSLPLPTDPALGRSLVDPDTARELIAGCTESAIYDVRPRYLEHDVGSSQLVLHRVEVAGRRRDVVLSIGRREWPAVVPGRGFGDELVPTPAAVVDGVTVAWYPFDPALPQMADGFERYGIIGPAERLAWVPQQRAVFAGSDRVVKVVVGSESVDRGTTTLALLGRHLRVPEVISAHPAAGVFVQERIRGRALGRDDALAKAGAAAGMIEVLRGIEAAQLPAVSAADLLTGLRHVTRLVAFAAPQLAHRVQSLLDTLKARLPGPGDGVVAHGDFNVGQMLEQSDGEVALVDTDTLCLASPALDPASYAANLLSGRPGDLEHCLAVAEALHRVPGTAPDGFDWYLAVVALRRLDRPIRRYKRRWAPRVDQLLTDVEVLAARIA